MTGEPNSPFDNDDLICGRYRLRLYVTGATPNSARAIVNLKEFCETHLKDNYELEIIDIYQQPLTAEADQVIAIPMLIKLAPMPQRRLIGDMSDKEKIFKGLNLAAGR
jgi:circadian clock protein KaiB